MGKFDNKYILITGASKGIGFALAENLDNLGAKLILHASSEDGINKLTNVFANKGHLVFKANFSEPLTLEDAWKAQINQEIKLDGFVNCVGLRSRRPLNLLKPAHVIEILQANVASFIEMSRLVCRKNGFNPGLSIITISSIAAHSGGPGVTAYASSKAANEAAVRCLAKELFKKEIRVNSLVCGQINTEAYSELMNSKGDQEDTILDRQYLGLGSTQNITDILLFLLGKESGFITGSSIPADGGYLS
jgi:NAD(P)-dependent dehydrogenase (short-subunit alcohol dehydrogenase family)